MVLDSGSSTLAFCNKQFIQDAQYQSSQYVPWDDERLSNQVGKVHQFLRHPRKRTAGTWKFPTPKRKGETSIQSTDFWGWKAVSFWGRPVHVWKVTTWFFWWWSWVFQGIALPQKHLEPSTELRPFPKSWWLRHLAILQVTFLGWWVHVTRNQRLFVTS